MAAGLVDADAHSGMTVVHTHSRPGGRRGSVLVAGGSRARGAPHAPDARWSPAGWGAAVPCCREAEVSPLNIPAWRGFPLRERVAALTGVPTFVENDAKALALAEGWAGAAAGCEDYVAMVVSTGIGGGIVLEGRLLDGRLGNAGHIGHVVVEPDGRQCRCGGRGCLEAEASGTAIAAITGAPTRNGRSRGRRPGGTLVGRAVASVANLLDLSLARRRGLGRARIRRPPFFAAAQQEVERRTGFDIRRGPPCSLPGSVTGPLGGGRCRRMAWRRPPRRFLVRAGSRARAAHTAAPMSRAGRDDTGWGGTLAAVARAVAAHPSLWLTAAITVSRLARPGWWRSAPRLPLPDPDYWRFRLETAYGGDGGASPRARETSSCTSAGAAGCASACG